VVKSPVAVLDRANEESLLSRYDPLIQLDLKGEKVEGTFQGKLWNNTDLDLLVLFSSNISFFLKGFLIGTIFCFITSPRDHCYCYC